MSTATHLSPSPQSARPGILSRALVLRFVSIVASSVGFYLPLAVVPVFAAANGATGSAGLANGALLVATVMGELVTPRIVGRLGYRWTLALGLVLLGSPALLLIASTGLPVLFLSSALRGLGFAISVVAGGALTAMLIPAQRRGEGLAIVGLVGGLPSLVALPLGVWAADRWGFGVVFAATAVAPLLALPTLPGLPKAADTSESTHGVLAGLRNGALMRPATIFAASASAAGVVVTYLPLAIGHHAAWVAPLALLLQPTASTLGRWFAGRLGDRRGQSRLLVPGLVLSILGMAAMAVTQTPILVLLGAMAFGTGFGVLQNASLSLMYARTDAASYSTVSAIWNAAYDMGMAVGAIGVGLLIGSTGYSVAFLVTAAVMVPALVMAVRETRTPELVRSPATQPELAPQLAAA
jgi:MFS family permease